MNEVAPIPVLAMTLFEKGIAGFGLVWIICSIVNSQLMSPMGELTLLAVWAKSFLGEVFAEAALDLGLRSFGIVTIAWWKEEVLRVTKIAVFLSLGWDLWFAIRLEGISPGKICFSADHSSKVLIFNKLIIKVKGISI